MTGQELATQTQQVVANIENPAFLEQIESLLPDNVPIRRFVQVAKTAIRTNADLVTADQNTLFAALIRCAQAGLYPDGHDAALVIYKGKVSFLPMIDGVGKQLAEYGWLLSTGAVYANDEFDYTDEPPTITHRGLRPGMDRGPLIAAYGIAKHADGRRLQRVLHPEDIAKRREKAQTDKVWAEWTEAMFRKSAGHAVARDVPLAEGDRARLDRALLSIEPADAAEQLYGPEAITEHINLETGEITPGAAPNTTGQATESGDVSQQAETAAPLPAAVPVPGDPDPDEEEPGPPAPVVDEIARAKAAGVASTKVTGSPLWDGLTLQEVHATGKDGTAWFSYVLRHPGKYDAALVAAVDVFVKGTPQAEAA